MSHTPEGRIKAIIKKILDRHMVWYFMPVPSGYQAKTVDFLCLKSGKFFAIEAKRPDKDATERQKFVLAEIRKEGGYTYVIDSQGDVDNLDKWLGGLLP